MLADYALSEEGQGGLGYWRVEAKVEPDNQASLRVATRSGLRREGLRRVERGHGDRDETASYVVLARLVSDPPLSEPESFRALLNSFLPRKRAIGQLLVRDRDGRVLLCQLTYKRDWDLPGRRRRGRRVAAAGGRPRDRGGARPRPSSPADLVLTDWLPPWGGWDDAVCLVFDGGEHDPAILDDIVTQPREIRTAEFCTSIRSTSGAPTSPPAASGPLWPPSSPAYRATPSRAGSARSSSRRPSRTRPQPARRGP